MHPVTLCVTLAQGSGRGASQAAFLCCAWERSLRWLCNLSQNLHQSAARQSCASNSTDTWRAYCRLNSTAAIPWLFKQDREAHDSRYPCRSLEQDLCEEVRIGRPRTHHCPGRSAAAIFPTGSGKSTLLRHLAGLACCDKSNGGSVKVLGREVQASGRLNGKLRRLRADIGYIFQSSTWSIA